MKYLFAVMIALSLFPCTCNGVNIEQEISEELNLEQLETAVPDGLRDMLAGYDLFSGEGAEGVFERLKARVIDTVGEHLGYIWKPAVQTLLIAVICSMMMSMLQGDRQRFPISMAGGAGIVFLTLSDTQSFFQSCVQTVEQLYNFSTVLMPCLAGVSVFAGASLSSGVKYTAAALFMNILLNFCVNLLVPLITVYLICVIGHTIFDQRVLGSVSSLIRWGCMTVLTGSVVVFTTYLGVAGLLTTASDAMTTRLTKSALTTGLPIVGRIISDTASTLVAGAAVLRNGIGVFGMFVILGILILPFVSMGIRYLVFKGVSKLSELFPNHKLTELIRGISGAYGMMMAVIGTGFVMIFLTIISMMNLIGSG